MKKYILLIVLIGGISSGCIKDPDTEANTYEGNFEALWKIIDRQYCYLDYKGIDWEAVYSQYQPRLRNVTDHMSFFDLLGEMLNELQDGHVNLYSPFNTSRYWDWYTDYPANFNSEILYSDEYLGRNYKTVGGIRYGKIKDGTIGYIYYGSFSGSFSDGNFSYIFNYFKDCTGLIIDVRNNGGGNLNYAEQMASYFFTRETLTGYIAHKTGPGHSDFSKPVAFNTPANSSLRWEKPVAVLSNRMSYSATNDFVNRMKNAPNAVIIGDKTGGGGGMPLSSELPNGWMVRFSACPMYDIRMQHTEWGIDPDIKVDMDPDDRQYDAIIERAVEELRSM